MIDSHCHLHYDFAPKTASTLIEESRKNGVTHWITVGVDLETLPAIVEISESHRDVYHSVGLHPHDAVNWTEGHWEAFEKASHHPKCRAIGEIGLDYHYENSSPHQQMNVLERQLELALTVKQPIIVHSREGEKDLLPRLKAYAAQVPAGSPIGVLHCFTGTQEFGQACIDLGFLVSFSGILTFKNAQDLRDAANSFPLDRLMIETDCPYLAPVPHRGKKCEPFMIRDTALALAQVKGTSLEELDRVTTETTKNFFRIV